MEATQGILGINRRNLEYVYRAGTRRRFPLVDDKIQAKRILESVGVAVPTSIAELERRVEIPAWVKRLREHDRFVVKPSRGRRGAGVRVFVGDPTNPGRDEEALAFHMAAILSGTFTGDARRDRVLVEEFVEECPTLREIHGGVGVSDVRVILHESRPVMAMLRIPCAASGCAANLHRGGVGVGIDPASGRTTFAVQRSRVVSAHPDTGLSLTGRSVPMWGEILDLVRPINRVFGLDYLGVDIIPHAGRGPVVLEVNARPGLTIQIANRRGLRDALARAREDRG